MGWAARAKQSRGNQTVEATKETVILEDKVESAFRKNPGAIGVKVTFSDREYVVDRRGCLRRAPAEMAKPSAPTE